MREMDLGLIKSELVTGISEMFNKHNTAKHPRFL